MTSRTAQLARQIALVEAERVEKLARQWDVIIEKLMFPPATGRLEAPCRDCGEHEIVCRCLREADEAEAEQ